MRGLLITLGIIWSQITSAAHIQLPTLTRSDGGASTRLTLTTDQHDNLKTLIIREGNKKPWSLTLRQLRGREQTMYTHESGRVTLKLGGSQELNSEAGGRVYLKYTKNAIFQNSGKVWLEIARGPHRWELLKNGNPVSSMRINVGSLGISSITVR